jgi:hypothetical protein
VPELVRNDAGGDADGSDNIGKVRTQLLDKSLLVAWTSQEPTVKREWVERTEEAQAMDDPTNKGVDRDHALGFQLPERNVNRPSIRAGIMQAVIGKISTFPDAHSGVAHQQQDIGGQIIAAEQFLLN